MSATGEFQELDVSERADDAADVERSGHGAAGQDEVCIGDGHDGIGARSDAAADRSCSAREGERVCKGIASQRAAACASDHILEVSVREEQLQLARRYGLE